MRGEKVSGERVKALPPEHLVTPSPFHPSPYRLMEDRIEAERGGEYVVVARRYRRSDLKNDRPGARGAGTLQRDHD